MEPSQSVESVHREEQLQETILSNTIDSHITGLSLEEIEFHDTRTFISAAEAINLLNQSKMLNRKTSSEIKSMRSSISSTPICRICRCDSVTTPVIKCPCKCRGSIGYVHELCLQRWHEVRRAKFCEICREKYEITYIRNPVEAAEGEGFLHIESFARILKFGLNFASLTAIGFIQMAHHILQANVNRAEPLTILKVMILIFCTGYFNYTYMDWLNLTLDDLISTLEDWWDSRYPFGLEDLLE